MMTMNMTPVLNPSVVVASKPLILAIKTLSAALPKYPQNPMDLQLYARVRMKSLPDRMVMQVATQTGGSSEYIGMMEAILPCETNGSLDRIIDPAFLRRVANIADTERTQIRVEDTAWKVETGGITCSDVGEVTPASFQEREAAMEGEWSVSQSFSMPQEVLKRALLYGTAEKSRYELNGVFFDATAGVLRIISTDGRRLYVRRITEVDETFSCFIHADQLKTLASLLKADSVVGLRIAPTPDQCKS